MLFDFGGTLDFPRHWLDRFLTHYQFAGLNLRRDDLAPAFEASTHMAYRAAASLQNYDMRELLRYLVGLQLGFIRDEEKTKRLEFSEALQSPSFMDAMTRRISESFVDESTAGLMRSRTIVTSLAKGLLIGVVSNFYGNLERILTDFGFDRVIAAIADSGRLGIYKPDSGIFEAAVAMLGVPAHDVVMVGDSLEKDCSPARRLGMRTVWLRHCEAEARDGLIGTADFMITTLAELKELQW
jgi:putative hydrolase of the HAD superfamily